MPRKKKTALEKEWEKLQWDSIGLADAADFDPWDGTDDDMPEWELKAAVEADKARYAEVMARIDEIEKIWDAEGR